MAVTWKKLAYEEDVITKALIDAAGDLIYGSADNTPAILTKANNGDVLTLAAGLPSWAAPGAPGAHAASHKNAGADELLLHELGEPTSAIDFDLQQATDLVVFTVVNEAARNALNAAATAVGQLCFATGELTLAICTESA